MEYFLSLASGSIDALEVNSIKFRSVTNSTITSNVNNYNIGSGSNFRISTNSTWRLTGINSGSDGRVIFIENVGNNNLRIVNEASESLASNRIITGTGLYQMQPSESIMLLYDKVTQRWRKQ